MDYASQLICSFRHFQLVRAALELGLFEWLLERGPASQDEIAAAMRLNRQHLAAFLPQLAGLNWLGCDGERYSAGVQACRLLGLIGPGGDSARELLGMGNPRSGWNRLSELLLTLDDDDAQQPAADDDTVEWPLPATGPGSSPPAAWVDERASLAHRYIHNNIK
ncbi:hypothetical protein ABWL39_07255 [Chitinivorax sp. PXF-14]|uniref:methyltransferase family protein n=1 Tax=Chitinivorax sp. PXF-14 TaxID=3230488 RepID=UPI0034656E2D